jgi:hypothetical protein
VDNVRDCCRARRGRVVGVALLAACYTAFLGCSSAPAPLSITMEHPETKQKLTCAAKDQLARADASLLASAVESCARSLEARGFIRQR